MPEVLTSFEDVVEELEATKGKQVRVGVYDLNTVLLVAGWEGLLASVEAESEIEYKLEFSDDGKAILKLAADACHFIEVQSGVGVFVRQGNLEIEIRRP